MIAIPKITAIASGIVIACPRVSIHGSESQNEKQNHNAPATNVSTTRSFNGR